MNNAEPQERQISSLEYFSGIVIPDSWTTIENFVDWYFEVRMPMMIPWDASVMVTDDATAICIFKKGQFQVELYLIWPNMEVVPHSHPGVEVITVQMGGGKLYAKNVDNTSNTWGTIYKTLKSGEVHGSGPYTKKGSGYAILAFQKWDDPNKMTSASVQWKGKTSGAVHDSLIEAYRPGSLISPGNADVTLANDNLNDNRNNI